MDGIFTLIVIVIMIVSMAGKIKSKSKKAQTPISNEPKGWIAKLNAYLEQIQKSVEQKGEPSVEPDQDDVNASTWRALMEKDTVGVTSSHPGDDEYNLGDFEQDLVEEPKPPKTRKISKSPKVRADEPLVPPVDTGTLQPALVRTRKRRRFELPVNPTELRRAVIWSEIIGPPVSLRGRRYDGP